MKAHSVVVNDNVPVDSYKIKYYPTNEPIDDDQLIVASQKYYIDENQLVKMELAVQSRKRFSRGTGFFDPT